MDQAVTSKKTKPSAISSVAAHTPSITEVREDLARVPLVRRVMTVVFILVAIFIARFSWQTPFMVEDRVEGERPWALPLLPESERVFYDIRQAYAALSSRTVAQDDRILMVTFNADTQWNTGERSPLDRTTLARALTQLDAMKPKAIGIDILVDQPQPDDELLIEALSNMKTPTWLGYATVRHNPADMIPRQEEFLDQLFARIDNPNVKPASLKVRSEADNYARTWPDQPKDLPPFLPVALTGNERAADYRGAVQFRAPANEEYQVFQNLPIDLFSDPETAPLMASEVEGKIVLVGGDLPDQDLFDVPMTRVTNEPISGLTLHAAMVAQALDRRLAEKVDDIGLWAIAVFVVLAGAFTSMVDVRPVTLSALIVGQLAFFGGMPFFFEMRGVDTHGMPAFGWLAGWFLAFLATEATVKAMGSEQKRFAHSALGKYLPRDIAEAIVKDPSRLSLKGERMPIYTMFTDIEGFTALSHTVSAETIASILNDYLDGMSDIVLKHGGTIDKFVGDAVVAFWGAPIARDDDADRAGGALLDIVAFLHEFAKGSSDRALLGRTRVGLHYGEAIVGNFGGQKRIQYTALGDAMNCAARLEGANKYLSTAALVSDEARANMTDQSVFRPMGRITVSGRDTPVIVWEPALGMEAELRKELTRLWREYESGNRSALHEIEAISAKCDNDVALAKFANRLRDAGPGETYILGKK